MLGRTTRRRLRVIAAEEWLTSVKIIHDFDSMDMPAARRRVAGRIAEEFNSESLIGSILIGIAIKFAFALLWKWFEEQLYTKQDLVSAGEL
tara:strand:+ start:23913 stop:24185 length:273 start_codon:yes stop_codon:yes gene_type:complete